MISLLTFLVRVLVIGVLLEVLLLRTFSRAGIYMIKESTPSWVVTGYQGLLFLGSVFFNSTAILVMVVLGLCIALFWARRWPWARLLAGVGVLILLADGLSLLGISALLLSLLALSTSAVALLVLVIVAGVNRLSVLALAALVATVLAFLPLYYAKALPQLEQFGVRSLLSGPSLYGLSEALAFVSIVLLFFAFGRPRWSKALIIPTLLSGALLVGYLVKPEMLPLISTWSLGLTLSLPFPLYLLGLWLLAATGLRSLGQAPLVACGVLLLFLSHRMLSLTYFNDLIIVGFWLLLVGNLLPPGARAPAPVSQPSFSTKALSILR